MDLLTRKHLEERIFGEVQTILLDGDCTYLQGLSRAALLEAMENELRFLGLYAHSDAETPIMIHAILEQYLDLWRMRYLSQQDSSISSTQPPTPNAFR